MPYDIPDAYATILECLLCGQTGLGVVGSGCCLSCIGAASRCRHCDSDVKITVFGDGVVQLDVLHAGGCRAA